MNQTIRTLLVDDELPARDELSYLLSAHRDIEIIRTVDNANDAVDAIRVQHPDLVFLDIEMPGQNGFHVIKKIMEMETHPLVVFVTAFDMYAIRAFEEKAMDYILKPVDKNRLADSLDRVRGRLADKKGGDSHEMLRQLLVDAGIPTGLTRISVEHSGRNILLDPKEIVFFNYEKRRVCAATRKGSFPCATDLTLDKLEGRLESFSFFRANRSQVVNLHQVRTYAPWFNGKYVLTMNDDAESEIIVSKGRVRDFKKVIDL